MCINTNVEIGKRSDPQSLQCLARHCMPMPFQKSSPVFYQLFNVTHVVNKFVLMFLEFYMLPKCNFLFLVI